MSTRAAAGPSARRFIQPRVSALLLLLCAVASFQPARAAVARLTAHESARTTDTANDAHGGQDAQPPLATPASGVWYEIFVRSWYDTDGDGTGDLNGVTAKLDYLKALGVSGIWLMPINPSPSYHGYDVTDYTAINPQYGSMADFERLLAEAHKRGIAVIIDLVINHTSSQHPWFAAAHNPHDPHHGWYSWADRNTDLAAISATGGPAWHALGKQHYLGIFTDQMPDLDYDTPAVRQEMIRIGRFWLAKGVDGFRLDAAQHIYLDFKRQADDPAVLAKNLAWWSQFRQGLGTVKPDTYLVGEVTQQTPEKLAPYFRPLSAVFDFPLATRLIDSAKNERADGLGAWLQRTETAYRTVAGRSGVDAPFLSNHDQERVMSQLAGNRAHMRMAAAMLLTLPGHPFVYYGEELGMRGRKPDEHLREPMRWHRDAQGSGETRWESFSAGDGSGVSVDAEQADGHSLLAWYRMLIGWRMQVAALRDGALRVPALSDPHLAAWELSDAHADVLVVHNLSRKPQTLVLDGTLRHFTRLRLTSMPGARIAAGHLHLPAYASVVLE